MFLKRSRGLLSLRLLSLRLLSTVFLFHCLITSTLQDDYTETPVNITAATGESASFYCGVSKSKGVKFTIQGNNNKTMSCPGNSTQEWQSLKWSCSNNSNILAAWTIMGISLSDNGTIFRCKATEASEVVGHLSVLVNSSYFGILIGCVIGGFFGILIVFGLIYVFLQRSESFQQCFRGKQEEDECTIVEESKGS